MNQLFRFLAKLEMTNILLRRGAVAKPPRYPYPPENRLFERSEKSKICLLYTVHTINLVQSSFFLIGLFACYDGIYQTKLTK